MHSAIETMLAKYSLQRIEDTVQALREIMQEIALLGLWRSKFFEHAAFYGGTSLRILYGLDRFSEDLDFSLLQPDAGFRLGPYCKALEAELAAFGFEVQVQEKAKVAATDVQSAFLKADTQKQLLLIQARPDLLRQTSPGQVVRIKIEIDTNPPAGFHTESRYLLQPIPFSVRSYTLPDLFAGKMHALLCRGWQNRVKGRDWYDLVWYCTHHPELRLSHLEERMRQSGHYVAEQRMSEQAFSALFAERLAQVDLDQAKREVLPFVRHPQALEVWSVAFFQAIVKRVRFC